VLGDFLVEPRLEIGIRDEGDAGPVGGDGIGPLLGPLEADRLVSLPDVPVAWVQSVVPISAVLIVIAEILTFPQVIAASLRPKGAGLEISGGASH